MGLQKAQIVSRGETEEHLAEKSQELKTLLKEQGFLIVSKNPDFIITLGGDGTFLFAERKYPGVPKLILKNSKICRLCRGDVDTRSIQKIKKGDFDICPIDKIKLCFKKNIFFAVNDVTVRNINQREALRFVLQYADRKIEVIGDGMVFATAQGSTGYFESITRINFAEGLGAAFNNSTKKIEPIIAKEGIFKMQVTRSRALVTFDNSPRSFIFKAGDNLEISLAEKKASIIFLR
ncbi:hypothetical protein HYV44_00790 [Candidatus Microgenomates bacterium]|nr:hypothetical protein [Candidatus Microgenomates bacterium]